MTKPISRYGISPGTGYREGELEIVEAPEGEWVRYEDIKHLLAVEPRGDDIRDAARYRAIRDVTSVFGGVFRQFPLDRHQLADGPHISGGHRLDAAIDALTAERAAENR